MAENTILDQVNKLEEAGPRGKGMVEKGLAIAFFLSILIRESLGISFDGLILIFGCLLAMVYLLGNWWLAKPEEANARTILITILYGLTSCLLTFALVFKEFFLAGSQEMSILGFVFLTISVGADAIASRKKQKVLNRQTTWRLSILTTLVIIFFLIPEDYRINFTYREHPHFLQEYLSKKGTVDFYDFKEDYFEREEK